MKGTERSEPHSMVMLNRLQTRLRLSALTSLNCYFVAWSVKGFIIQRQAIMLQIYTVILQIQAVDLQIGNRFNAVCFNLLCLDKPYGPKEV